MTVRALRADAAKLLRTWEHKAQTRAMPVLLDQTIFTDYGQFDLVWDGGFGFDGDFGRVFNGQVNGLAGAASGEGLYLNLAHHIGGSAMRIELLDAVPALDERWEDVVEVSLVLPDGRRASWVTWAGESFGPLDLDPGSYRARVSARGRDEATEDEEEEDEEEEDVLLDYYLVQLWPAEPRPDEILRTTSANAAYWHRVNGADRRVM